MCTKTDLKKKKKYFSILFKTLGLYFIKVKLAILILFYKNVMMGIELGFQGSATQRTNPQGNGSMELPGFWYFGGDSCTNYGSPESPFFSLELKQRWGKCTGLPGSLFYPLKPCNETWFCAAAFVSCDIDRRQGSTVNAPYTVEKKGATEKLMSKYNIEKL